MRLIEGALQDTYRPGILADLERVLSWAPGSVEAILAGGNPTEVTVVTGLGALGRSVVDQMDDRVAPSDDADIQLVMDSNLPDDEKHRLVRELLQDRIEERQRRVERAQRYIELYRRAQGE